MRVNILKGPHRPVLSTLSIVGFVLMTVTGANAGLIWNNGAVGANSMVCDNCSGSSFTIYDNFQLSSTMAVTGFDFTDYIGMGTASDYASTNWSIYQGDPSVGGVLQAQGIANAVITAAGTAYTFTASGLNVVLGPGNYYLGTSNNLKVANDAFERASAAGNGLAGYMQYNGSSYTKYPFTGFGGTDTAFGVAGVGMPEPSTLTLGFIALAAFYIRRRLTA